MKKNNKITNTKNKILLSSLSLFGVSAAAITSIAFTTSSNSTSSIIKNDEKITNQVNQKQVSSNSINRNSILNPDEVFFYTTDLSQKDPWDKTTNKVVQANVDFFKKLGENLNKIVGLETEELKKLKQIPKDVVSYVNYRTFEENYKASGLDKPTDQGGILWDSIKQQVLDAFQTKAEFQEILDQAGDINALLQSMSGIINDPSLTIKTISNKSNKKFQIDANNGTPQTSLSGVNTVAGNEYNTLVKVAELDLTQNKTFILDFEYQASASIQGAKAKLIIKNENGQINNAANLQEAYNNLDIFGRYYDMTGQIGQGSYKQNLSNVVLKKDGSTLSVMIRVKQNEKLNNIKFNTDDSNNGTPTKFGILDVQADSTSTFLDILNNNQSIGKLITDPNQQNVNQLNSIQFFSDKITVKYDSNLPNLVDKNRKIEFYQGKDQETKFGLNFITGITDSSNDYEKILIYNNGQQTQEQQMITLNYDGNEPTTLNPARYDFHVDLQNKLPEQVKKLSLSEISKINLNSMASGNIAKQTLTFAQGFYLIGISNTTSPSKTNDYDISLRDITEKVFYEKPEQFQDTQTTKQSSTVASVQTDIKSNVVKALGSLYDSWYNNQKGELYQSSNGITVEYVTFNGNNVKINNVNIGKTGPEIINGANGINTYWKAVASKIRELYNSSYPEGNINRFAVSNSNTGENIVNNILLGNIEYITNVNKVQDILNNVIKAWNNDKAITNPNVDDQNQPIVPTFDQLEKTTQEAFAVNLAQLIEIQYGAILNEFKTNQLLPVYNGIMNQFNSSNVLSNVYVINTPNDILEFIPATANSPRLIKYKQNGFNQITSQQKVTLKNQFGSLINLLNFGSEDGGIRLVDSIINTPLLNSKFKSYASADSLLSYDQQNDYSNRLSQLQIIQSIMNYFNYSFGPAGNSFEVIDNNSGSKTDLKTAINNIIKSISTQTSSFKPLTESEFSSYWLDNIIAGTNAVSSMMWKLDSINTTTRATIEETLALKERINWILAYQQASPEELASWNNIIANSYNFDDFAQKFSGRNSDNNTIIKTFEEITKDSSILAKRVPEFDKGSWLAITSSLKYLWPIVVALIGIGIISISSYGIATRWKQVKTTTHSFIKWSLFVLIPLGIAAVALSIVFGFVPMF